MNSYEGISGQTLFDTFKRSFGVLSPGLKNHLQSVYSCLSLGLLAATIGAYANVTLGILRNFMWASSIGMFVFTMLLMSSPVTRSSDQKKRIGYFLGICLCGGHLTGQLVNVVMILNPQVVVMALLSTGVIFLCFTLSALLNKSGSYLYLGGIAGSLLSLLMVMQIANIFMGSYFIWKVENYLAVAVMILFIMFDTQMMIYRYHHYQDKDYVMHACHLFLDILSLFKHILVLLAEKDANKRKRKD